MIFFEWKEEYELDLPHIDLQHTMIVNMLNELYASIQAGGERRVVGKTLDSLLEYVEVHFETEEGFMREYGYPGLDDHFAEHEKLRSRVLQLSERYHDGSGPAATELLEFLREWLQEHIAKVDKAFGTYVHEKFPQNLPEAFA